MADHIKLLQVQYLASGSHRGGDLWGASELDFKAHALAIPEDEQVQFGAAMKYRITGPILRGGCSGRIGSFPAMLRRSSPPDSVVFNAHRADQRWVEQIAAIKDQWLSEVGSHLFEVRTLELPPFRHDQQGVGMV